jgi:CubicO group peptidase (beta-lactamase class C family)
MSDVEIHGIVARGFEKVRDAFADNFDGAHECVEVGATFSAYHDGKSVVHLWGGYADQAKTKPWSEHTVVNMFSSTKGVAACCLAILNGRGLLNYNAPVAQYWPEFSQNGKERITVNQALSHQGGLSGLREPTTIADVCNWDTMVKKIADAQPLWEPGTAAGYHAITWGFLAGELVRRITGKSIGKFLHEELSAPLGLDLFIGLASDPSHPIAQMIKASGVQNQTFAEMSEILKLTLGNPTIEAEVANEQLWQQAEIPAANGQGNAEGLARIYSPFATDGTFEGRRVLPQSSIAESTREVFYGVDMNMGKALGWGAGGFFVRNEWRWFGPNSEAFGHSGWGGSLGFADPKARISVGYVPNQMDTNLQGDPRSMRLIAALYDCRKS